MFNEKELKSEWQLLQKDILVIQFYCLENKDYEDSFLKRNKILKHNIAPKSMEEGDIVDQIKESSKEGNEERATSC